MINFYHKNMRINRGQYILQLEQSCLENFEQLLICPAALPADSKSIPAPKCPAVNLMMPGKATFASL